MARVVKSKGLRRQHFEDFAFYTTSWDYIPYPEEFKQEAVRLVTEQRLPASQVARDLGIDPATLRRWLRAQVPDVGAPTEPLPTSAELARLLRENEQLRMERDILNKAIGIFSRMPQ